MLAVAVQQAVARTALRQAWPAPLHPCHGMKLLAYNKKTGILWGAVQEMQKEITSLKGEITKLKKMKNYSD